MSSRTRRRASVSLLVLLIFLTQPALIRAANALDVVINEVAWMGTTASAYHEWIELYNTTGAAINLTGWTLSAADGTPTITLTGSIPAYGHYLLERSDDDPVPGVAADLTYTGVMSNEGEDLHLFDASAALIDQVDASAGWFAGHAAGRVPMARYDPLLPGSADNWTYAPRCGTPTNSVDISHTCALTVTYTGADLDYAVYFNPLFLTATTITTTTTPMESALLTLIDTTASTLDAAIYGLNWQSVIEALIAAHQRGVTVRIVGDDDAATTSYNAGGIKPSPLPASLSSSIAAATSNTTNSSSLMA